MPTMAKIEHRLKLSITNAPIVIRARVMYSGTVGGVGVCKVAI